MACAVATPVLEPSGDFPAWLEAQGVNAEVAQAMDSELGIRDYGVLHACVGDGLVRAELLATARDRLPFGFYAVLRKVVKALQGAEPHDAGTARWDDAASSPGDVTLGGLVDVLLALFSGLSRELLITARRLGAMDGTGVYHEGSSMLSTEIEPQDFMPEDAFPPEERNEYSSHAHGDMEFKNSEAGTSVLGDEEEDCERPVGEGVEERSPLEVALRPPIAWRVIKMEACDNKDVKRLPGKNEEDQSGLIIGNVTSLKTVEQLYPRPEFSRNAQWSQQLLASGVARGIGGNIGGNVARGPVAFSVDANSMRLPRPPNATGCVSEQSLASWRAIMHSAAAAAATTVPNGGKSQHGQYVCELCQRRFVRSDYLQKHMYTHTGEKPYHCNVCGRGFSQRTNCQRHQGQHLKPKW